MKYYAELIGGQDTDETEWSSLKDRLSDVVRGVFGEWGQGLLNN